MLRSSLRTPPGPAALLAVLALVASLPPPASSQVTVGYSNPIFGIAARGRIDQQGLGNTRRFAVDGGNAQPINGSLIYDESTVWTLVDPTKPSTLSVVNLDPLVELRQRTISRNDARVQRTEAVTATVAGPLATTLPFNPRDALGPLELALPDQLLTVFPDPDPEANAESATPATN